ncbi:MAG: hypothetical protein PVF83_10185 [Anaerolineales bacterium]|jgi:hypothetical protein
MDPIEVSSRVNQAGEQIPFLFTWEGNSYRVDGVGRRWEENEGEHILVMVQPDNQVYELRFEPTSSCWQMVKKHEPPVRHGA